MLDKLAEAKKRILRTHPDRGGSHLKAIRAIRAYKKLQDPKIILSKIEQDFLEYIRRYPGIKSRYIARHFHMKPQNVVRIGNKLGRYNLAYGLNVFKKNTSIKLTKWYKGIRSKELKGG